MYSLRKILLVISTALNITPARASLIPSEDPAKAGPRASWALCAPQCGPSCLEVTEERVRDGTGGTEMCSSIQGTCQGPHGLLWAWRASCYWERSQQGRATLLVLSAGLNTINKSSWVVLLPSRLLRIGYLSGSFTEWCSCPQSTFQGPPCGRYLRGSGPWRSACSLWIRRGAPRCPLPCP